MVVYLLSFAVFAFAFFGLGIGVLAGRGAIRGTCGGLNNPGSGSGSGSGCGGCGRSADGEGDCPRRRSA